MIKCIMFDIGGVLMQDFNKEYYSAYLSRLSGMGRRKVMDILNGKEISLGYLGMITKEEMETRLAEKLRISKEKVRWYELYEKHGKLDKRMLALAKRLHGRYRIAYLSNIDRSRYEHTLKLFKPYAGIFDYRFASFAIGMQKPYCAIYNYVLSRMGMEAGEVVFIDNQEENVEGARETGMKAILFNGIAGLERELGAITRL